jgi:hypothetical protein
MSFTLLAGGRGHRPARPPIDREENPTFRRCQHERNNRPWRAYTPPAGGIRVVEVLAALSLTTDLASGVSFEKGLRTCAVATAFGRELGLPRAGLSVVFHTALARHRVHLARA